MSEGENEKLRRTQGGHEYEVKPEVVNHGLGRQLTVVFPAEEYAVLPQWQSMDELCRNISALIRERGLCVKFSSEG